MTEELEITVQVTCNYENLNNMLLEKGFKVKEEYTVLDIYVIPNEIDISSTETLELLSKCVLIRNVLGIEKELLYKYKEYDAEKRIIHQGKSSCSIIDVQQGIRFMEAIGYSRLFQIEDRCIVYYNETTELIVQIVNNEYIFIEIEGNIEHENIKDLIKKINVLSLPIVQNNYFAKKAEILLDKELNR